MANRGERKRQKSISAPKVRGFPRKEDTFTPKSRPGAHNMESSVPLSFALRQVIGAVSNFKETKRILSLGAVIVNGSVKKKPGFAIGLFDVIDIPASKKKYRILLDTKGRIVAKEIDMKGGKFKVSKVTGKRTVKGGRLFITTNDGFNIEVKDEKVSLGDSVRISLPELRIEDVYPMQKGSSAFVIGGVHTGKVVRVEGITKGSLKTHTVAELASEGGKFQTVIDYVLVVGKTKPEIEALE